MPKTYFITAYPYAVQNGVLIGVPDDVKDIKEYINEHWNSIRWSDVDLDYCGTDYEFEEESV